MELTLVYATRFGQAKKIMEVLGDQWTQAGLACRLHSLDEVQRQPQRLAEAAAAIVGAPIYYGAFDKRLTAVVSQHHRHLNAIPSAFFVVCFAAGSPQARDQVEAIKLSRQFLHQTGWDPPITDAFAGALRYSQYGWFQKRLVHWIAKKAGVHSNLKQDLELTNWADVKTFGQLFVDQLHGTPVEQGKWL